MALTKAEWEKLVEKAQWDIKVALRGPDTYSGETLKWFTTSVIRGRVRKVFRVGGLVNSDLKMVVLPSSHTPPELKKVGGATLPFAWNASHFLEHVQTAAYWLNIPILTVPADVWFQSMQLGNTKTAGFALLKAAEGQGAPPELLEELRRHISQGISTY